MPQSIGSSSLLIQRALSQAQDAISTSAQRLSTGSRLNSAKDDPVAFAQAIQLDSQIRGLNQSVKNANEGISLFQTAESAVTEISDLLQSIRELAVQASNTTASDADRALLQLQMDQLTAQIDSLSSSATYNGKNLLDGSLSDLSFQLGTSSDQSISATIASTTTNGLNLNPQILGDLNGGRITDNLYLQTISSGDLTLNGHTLSAIDFNAALPAYQVTVNGTTVSNYGAAVAAYINSNTNSTGVTANAYNIYKGATGATGITDGSLRINGAPVASSTSLTDLVNKINAADTQYSTGVTALLSSDGSIILSNTTGLDIGVSGVSGTGFSARTYAGYVSLSDSTSSDISWAASSVAALAKLQALGFTSSQGADHVTSNSVNNIVLNDGDVLINGVSIGASGGTAAAKAAAINLKTSLTGVTATATNTPLAFTLVLPGNLLAGDIHINNVDLGTVAVFQSVADFAAVINTFLPLPVGNPPVPGPGLGVTASVPSSGENAGKLLLTSTTNAPITVTYGANGGQVLGFGLFPGTSLSTSSLTLTSADNTPIRLEGTGVNTIGFPTLGGPADVSSFNLNLNTLSSATAAITRIDDAITSIENNLSHLGALQNRFQSSISFLETSSQNLSTAKSNITDVDFAAETAALTRAQILQQAGISILAQANAQMQSVLALLK